jgi:hypothetical protein
VFEGFLTLNGLAWEKIQVETSPAESYRPDYLVHAAGCELIFEVKELAEDENFEISNPSHPHIKSFSGTVGNHVRRMIHGSKKQIQYGANNGIPPILVIYAAH